MEAIQIMAQNVAAQQQAGQPGASQAGGQPAQQEDELHPFLKAVHENYKLVLGVVGAVLIIVAGYAAYDYFQTSQWEQAKEEMGGILTRTVGKERAEALKAFLPEAPAKMKPSVRMELAKAYDQGQEYDEAAKAWGELGQDGDASVKMLALMGRANSLRAAGKPAEAVEQLDVLLASDAGPYRAPILQQLALAAEDAKNWGRAIEAYESLLNENASQDKQYLEHKLKLLRKLEQG